MTVDYFQMSLIVGCCQKMWSADYFLQRMLVVSFQQMCSVDYFQHWLFADWHLMMMQLMKNLNWKLEKIQQMSHFLVGIQTLLFECCHLMLHSVDYWKKLMMSHHLLQQQWCQYLCWLSLTKQSLRMKID